MFLMVLGELSSVRLFRVLGTSQVSISYQWLGKNLQVVLGLPLRHQYQDHKLIIPRSIKLYDDDTAFAVIDVDPMLQEMHA